MTEELKSCPWCSEPARIEGNSGWTGVEIEHHIDCPMEGHQVTYEAETPAKIVAKAWNTRPQDPPEEE